MGGASAASAAAATGKDHDHHDHDGDEDEEKDEDVVVSVVLVVVVAVSSSTTIAAIAAAVAATAATSIAATVNATAAVALATHRPPFSVRGSSPVHAACCLPLAACHPQRTCQPALAACRSSATSTVFSAAAYRCDQDCHSRGCYSRHRRRSRRHRWQPAGRSQCAVFCPPRSPLAARHLLPGACRA